MLPSLTSKIKSLVFAWNSIIPVARNADKSTLVIVLENINPVSCVKNNITEELWCSYQMQHTSNNIISHWNVFVQFYWVLVIK